MNTKWLVAVAAVAAGSLFFLHVVPLFIPESSGKIRVRPGEVEAVTLYYEDTPYLLNFAQQNTLFAHLNRAVYTPKLSYPPTRDIEGISRLVIHRFKEEDISLTPIDTAETNIYFFAPSLHETGYLMDVTGSELKRFLASCHD